MNVPRVIKILNSQKAS